MARRSEWIAWSLLLGLGAAYQLLFLKEGVGLVDEGHLANTARRIAAGEALYRDVYTVYPPASFEVVAALFALSGPKLVVVRLFHVALTLVLSGLVYWIARRWMSVAWALGCGLLVSATGWEAIVGRCHYAHLYAAFPIGAIALLGTAPGARAGRARLVGVGLLGGVTLGFRLVPFVGLAAAVVAMLLASPGRLRGTWRAVPWLALGFFAVWIPILARLAATQALGPFLEAALWTSFDQYLGNGGFNLPFPELRLRPTEWSRAGLSSLLVVWEFHAPILIYAATALHLAIRFARSAECDRLRLGLLVFGSILFLRALGRSDYYHLAPVLAPACVLGVDLLARATRRALGGRGERLAPAIVAGLLLLSFWTHRLDEVIARIARSEPRVALAPGGPWLPEAGPLDDLVRVLRSSTAADEPILVLPYQPIVYFVAGRPSPTRHDWLFPGYLPDAAAVDEFLASVERAAVRVVVYAPGSVDGRADRSLAGFAPAIDRYLRERFEARGRYGPFVLMTRRAESGGSVDPSSAGAVDRSPRR